jgi:hypothetical protein
LRYGVGKEKYEEMLRKQNGTCAICESPQPGYGRRRFCIDHDHKTGEKRGLLCYACNLGLGKFKDNPTLLDRAMKYLSGYAEQKI